MIQRTLYTTMVAVMAFVLGLMAYRIGHQPSEPLPPSDQMYLIYNTEDGTTEQTTDETIVDQRLKNKHLRVFTFDAAQIDEIFSPRKVHKRKYLVQNGKLEQ